MGKLANFLKTIIGVPASAPDLDRAGAAASSAIIPRDQHNISRKLISTNCRKVLYRLNKHHHSAYLVGGSVRDLLLGHEPKDFDVATSATPEQVRKLFRNCRLIGRRFRLAHIYFKNEIIEVATFRANEPNKRETSHKGLVLRDNVYGNIEEDVLRRDFTVNALLYNITDFTVIDYVGGLEDLQKGMIRLIGEPSTRYREDPVRILRAIRFAAKLGFQIEDNTAAPIDELADLLAHVPPARLLEEISKLLLSGNAAIIFSLLLQYKLFQLLFPSTHECLSDQTLHLATDELLQAAFKATDDRVGQGKTASLSFLFAVILWFPMIRRCHQYQADGFRRHVAMQKACEDILMEENRIVSIPKRMNHQIREIWFVQQYLENRKGRRPLRMVHHPRFRAAYDFLLLRGENDPKLAALGEWWTQFSQARNKEQQKMIEQLQQNKRKKQT